MKINYEDMPPDAGPDARREASGAVFGAPMTFQTKRTAQHNAESRALLAVGKRVFNRRTGARGTIVEWPTTLPEDAYSAAIAWDGGEPSDVMILEITSFSLLLCDEPVSAADELPVPGAAVRAQCQNWLHDPGGEARVFGRMLEAALSADGLASQELPTREEIARELAARYVATVGGSATMFDDIVNVGMRAGYLAAADYVLSLLARRPATDEAEGLRKLNESELERLRGEYAEAFTTASKRIADLESQLASVKASRSEAREVVWQRERERDEALAKLAKVERGCQEAMRKADDHRRQRDELQDKQRELTEAVQDAERERDEARDELTRRSEPVVIPSRHDLQVRFVSEHGVLMSYNASKFAEDVLHEYADDRASVSVPQGDMSLAGACWHDVSLERNQLRAELDESKARFAECLQDRDHFRAELDECRGRLELMTQDWQGRKADCDVLRAELRDTNAELAATVREYDQNEEFQSLCEQQRCELEKLRAELEKTRGAWHIKNDMLKSCDADDTGLRAELEKTRAELAACADKLRAATAKGILQSELHEALRAACVMRSDEEVAHHNVAVDPDRYGETNTSVRRLHGFVTRVQAALKPVPSAWQHISSDGDAHTFRHTSGAESTVEGFATWQEAAECLGEPQNTGAPQEPQATPQLRPHHGGQAEADATMSSEPVQHPPPDPDDIPIADWVRGRGARQVRLAHDLPQPVVAPAEVEALAGRLDKLERLARATAAVANSLSVDVNSRPHSDRVRAMCKALEALGARKESP